MKNHLLICFFLGFNLSLSALNVHLNWGTFRTGEQNYVEIFFKVEGQTVHFQSLDSVKMKGELEVVIYFKDGETIIKADKYRLSSPIFDRKNISTLDFVDLKRYVLPNGTFEMVVEIVDLNDKEGQSFKSVNSVFVNYDKSNVYLSDIQVVNVLKPSSDENNLLVKSGYYLEPNVTKVLEKTQKNLIFYAEVYNTQAVLKDDFLVRYYVQKKDSKDDGSEVLMRYKRLKPEVINAFILTIDIKNIPSGMYELVVEIRNRDNEFVTSKVYEFYRSNPYFSINLEDYKKVDLAGSFVETMEEEQLNYCLKAIYPKVDQTNNRGLNTLTKEGDLKEKRQFLLLFWAIQDHNDPETPFWDYMKKVMDADKRFASTLGRGFETDRGYIFLKYGEPNEVIREESDPSAPPYEIWRYNELGNQLDVKFVFYNPDLAGNNFQLLHSTKRGELQNPQWKRILYKNSPQRDGNYFDSDEVESGYGKRLNELFGEDNR